MSGSDSPDRCSNTCLTVIQSENRKSSRSVLHGGPGQTVGRRRCARTHSTSGTTEQQGVLSMCVCVAFFTTMMRECMCMCACVCVCMRLCVYVCLCTCVCVRVCAFILSSVCVCVCVCVCSVHVYDTKEVTQKGRKMKRK